LNNPVYQVQNLSFYYKVRRPHPAISFLFSGKWDRSPSRFKALDNITFDVERGTKVGIIGRNGSGKSTLLRILAGIYSPDEGLMMTNSKSVSMLAIGTGFDIHSTGIENIYLNSLLRGYRKKEVEERMERIIEFAELGDFINKPVKTYSTGMRMRLAFSIAVHFEPDVLLIDEALSVGDAQFQKKSANKMNELIRGSERTVIIVSHSIPLLQKECDRVIWMETGKIRMHGEAAEVLNAYAESLH
jgi:ABC-type polysaccharide/polyol phosphate transport system ATPase subunit